MSNLNDDHSKTIPFENKHSSMKQYGSLSDSAKLAVNISF